MASDSKVHHDFLSPNTVDSDRLTALWATHIWWWAWVRADIMEGWKRQKTQLSATHQQKKQEELSAHCGNQCWSEKRTKQTQVQIDPGAVTILMDLQKSFGKGQLVVVWMELESVLRSSQKHYSFCCAGLPHTTEGWFFEASAAAPAQTQLHCWGANSVLCC